MNDPYEQQLLAVFESCDVNGTGQLDSDGLIQLCDQLHLEDGREQLMDCLLPAFTFYQFRDALLSLLDSSRQHSDTDREQSPEREVSPKFVFGQKKYGRRSRPESAEQESDDDVDEIDVTDDLADSKMFLPFAYEENAKTKPHSLLIDDCQLESETAVTPTSVQSVILDKEEVESPRGQGEAELRLAAQQLGVGADGYLDPLELSSVCRAVGMEKMADEVVKQVFAKLKVNKEGRISFTEFLQLFRSTHTASPPTDSRSLPCTPPLYQQQSSLTSLDTFSSGYVSSEMLVDVWEAGGVANAGGLLMDLGLTSSSEVNMTSLSNTLDEEIRSMASKSVSSPSPQVNTLTAALALSQVQLKWTRSCLEQMTGERDKLHVDLAEANQRATLLAQEVDDRHARMERTSQMQIKMLEKRHAEQVKQLSVQLAVDRDQLTAATLRLEKKLAEQQEEEAKLRVSLNTLQAEFETIEKDNQNLVDKLAASELAKNKSEQDQFEIQQLQQKVQELEVRSERVPSLLQQLATLQAENTTLRDRNDELTVQVENLSARPICRRQNSSTSLESGVGGGTKRRGNSPLALPPDHLWDEESPRLGKVRRYCTDPDLSLESVPMEGLAIRRTLHHSESGLEADLDTLDNSFTMSSPSVDKITFNIGGSDDAYISEIDQLRSTVAELQQENKEYRKKLAITPYDSTPVKCHVRLPEEEIKRSSSSLNTLETESTEVQTSLETSSDVDRLEKRCCELRNTLQSVQKEILKILSEKKACNEENCVLKQKIEKLNETIPVTKSFVDERLSIENSSGPLTYTISKVPCSPEEVSNMESVFSPSLKDSSNNVALKCFPFMNPPQTNSDSPYCLFPKDKRDQNVFKFENLSQFAFELSQSLNDSNLTGDFFSTNLGCEPLSLNLSDKESSPVNSKVEKSVETCDKAVAVIKEDFTDNPLTEKYETVLKENDDLKIKCTELETSLELMRVEFEKCEDYWQGKLNEERAIFEQEQRLSDEKFNELEDKIQEYAELFGSDDGKTNGRLPTIDERDSLERQVTDLEEEFEEFKRLSKMETQSKTGQIESLKLELQTLQSILSQTKETQDVSIQVPDVAHEFRLHQPHSNPNPKICIPALEVTPSECCCSCHTMSRRVLTRLRESKTQLQTECDMLHRRREIILHQLSQLHQRSNLVYTPMPDRRLASDVEMFHNLSSRLRYQELRCRHLQSALKHHHQKTDKLLQNAWDQYRSDLSSIEKNFQNCQEKLQHQSKLCKQQMERLAASDVLVKDLYKENAQLISLVQKLEEQNLFVDQSIMNSRV